MTFLVSQTKTIFLELKKRSNSVPVATPVHFWPMGPCVGVVSLYTQNQIMLFCPVVVLYALTYFKHQANKCFILASLTQIINYAMDVKGIKSLKTQFKRFLMFLRQFQKTEP